MISSGTNETRLQSLRPLAQLAMRESGADGFAIYAVDSGSGACVEKCSGGLKVPDTGESGFRRFSFPLRVNGEVTARLVFGFIGKEAPPFSQIVLGRVITGIEAVWSLFERRDRYARLAARIGALETELADSKIADRTLGLLEGASSSPDALTAALHHIESVLRARQAASTFEQLVKDLEQELQERELAVKAKAVLQSEFGMSEEQAHLHLRITSRRSRRPMREIARELIEARG
jgi:hypothetical protein